MKKQHYSIGINASREKVYRTMLENPTYQEWTSVFGGGSTYEGDWSERSVMRFLGSDPEHPDVVSGMISRVVRNLENEFVSLENMGQIVNGTDDMSGENAKKWQGGLENYTFKDTEGGTELEVDIDVPEEYTAMFAEMWPKGLENIKKISER